MDAVIHISLNKPSTVAPTQQTGDFFGPSYPGNGNQPYDTARDHVGDLDSVELINLELYTKSAMDKADTAIAITTGLSGIPAQISALQAKDVAHDATDLSLQTKITTEKNRNDTQDVSITALQAFDTAQTANNASQQNQINSLIALAPLPSTAGTYTYTPGTGWVLLASGATPNPTYTTVTVSGNGTFGSLNAGTTTLGNTTVNNLTVNGTSTHTGLETFNGGISVPAGATADFAGTVDFTGASVTGLSSGNLGTQLPFKIDLDLSNNSSNTQTFPHGLGITPTKIGGELRINNVSPHQFLSVYCDIASQNYNGKNIQMNSFNTQLCIGQSTRGIWSLAETASNYLDMGDLRFPNERFITVTADATNIIFTRNSSGGPSNFTGSPQIARLYFNVS